MTTTTTTTTAVVMVAVVHDPDMDADLYGPRVGSEKIFGLEHPISIGLFAAGFVFKFLFGRITERPDFSLHGIQQL